MPAWAFFLRAVNVSGQNRVKMEVLREDLRNAGLTDVGTLLASGNVVATATGDRAALATTVEAAVARQAGRRCAVLTRSAAELDAVIAAVAPHEAAVDDGVLAVALLSGTPTDTAIAKLAAFDGKGDTATLVDRAVILRCRAGQAGTPYTTDRLERLLGVEATARNPNTLRKVRGLMGDHS